MFYFKQLFFVVIFASFYYTIPIAANTPDGETPSTESVCNESILGEDMFGLCNAYCEALDCEGVVKSIGKGRSCQKLFDKWVNLHPEHQAPPCVNNPQLQVSKQILVPGTTDTYVDAIDDLIEGNDVTYKIVIKNVSNANELIQDISIEDSKFPDGLICDEGDSFDLSLNAGEEFYCKYTVKVEEDDDIIGVINDAFAKGYDVYRADVTSEKDDAKYTSDPRTPELNIYKKLFVNNVEQSNGIDVNVGTLLDWTIIIVNTGNVPLKITSYVDPADTLSECMLDTSKDLAPDEQVFCSYSTNADFGDITNTFSADATDNGNEVSGEASFLYTGVNQNNPVVTISQSIDTTVDLYVGDVIEIDITVENTGNVALTHVETTDTLSTDKDLCNFSTLAIGEEYTCTSKWTAELAANYFNFISTTWKDDLGNEVTSSNNIGIPVLEIPSDTGCPTECKNFIDELIDELAWYRPFYQTTLYCESTSEPNSLVKKVNIDLTDAQGGPGLNLYCRYSFSTLVLDGQVHEFEVEECFFSFSYLSSSVSCDSTGPQCVKYLYQEAGVLYPEINELSCFGIQEW